MPDKISRAMSAGKVITMTKTPSSYIVHIEGESIPVPQLTGLQLAAMGRLTSCQVWSIPTRKVVA